MDKTFTLDDLSNFARKERSILRSLGLEEEMKATEESTFPLEPSRNTMDKLLNYSRVLSVRKSRLMGTIEMILN